MRAYDLGIFRSSRAAGRCPDQLAVGPAAFDDPRQRISVGVLEAGESIGPRRSWPGREEAWIAADPGAASLGPDGSTARTGRGVLAGFSGSIHGLANPGATPIRYIRVEMGDDLAGNPPEGEGGAGAAPEWAPLDQDRLQAEKAHGGMGEIRFRSLWEHDRFLTPWGFIHHVLVEPGTSVGYHRHHTVQECYLILAGTGVMKVDGAVFEAGPGACVPNRLGGAHGLAAPGEPVEFINLGLYTAGRFDATDLGDNLSDCLT